MDYPPPPLFRRHHHHHHHRLKYGDFLHPPDFIPNPYTHHLPPPPSPQARRSHILLAPPPPAPRHTAHPPPPPRLNFFPPRHPILDRSHPYEVDLHPKPYIYRNFPPPPPPPETRIHLRLIHDFSERKSILNDEIVCQGRSDSYVHILAESRDRQLHWGARELRSGVPDIGDRKKYRDNFCPSRELYNIRDNIERRWDNGINDCGRYFDDERDYGEKPHDGVMNNRGSKKMDYDETRRDSINGWIRGLYKDKDCEGADDGRRLNHGTNDAILLQLGNMRPESMENASSLGRLSGRLRSRVSDGEVGTSKKKRRMQKEIATNRSQTRKNFGRDNGGNKCRHVAKESSGSRFKGKENKGSECLQTRMDSKREEDSLEPAISFKSNALVAEAILAQHCAAAKMDIKSTIVNTRITSSMPCSPMDKSNEDVGKPEILDCALGLPSDPLGTSKELLDKALVSENGRVIGDANDIGEIAVKNQPQKDMNLQGLTVVESGNTRRDRLRSKRKARKKRLHETSMQMRKDSVDITSANDYFISLASPQLCSDANGLGEVAVRNQPQKDMNLECPTVVGSGSTFRKKRKARKKHLLETSMLKRKDSGHSINDNDCTIPLASPQHCSDANGLGEIAVKNQPQKDVNLEGPSIGSGSTRQKKRKGRKQFIYKTSLNMRMDRSHIIGITPSASLQPSSDTTLAKGNLSAAFIGVVPDAVSRPTFGGLVSEKPYSNGDSCKLSFPNLNRKRSSLTTSVSPYVADSAIPECSDHAERLVTSTEDTEAERCAHDTSLASEGTGHLDSLGFNQHGNNVVKFIQNEVSVFDAEKSIIESIDQYAKLDTDRVDDISEHSFQHGLQLLENPFIKEPSKVMVSLEGNDVAGLSQEDRCFSEIVALNPSSESDSALTLKPENVIISNVGSADANLEDVFRNEVNITQIVVDSEKSRSSIGDIDSVEVSLEAISNAKNCSCVDYLSNLTRKRKAQGDQTLVSGTNVALVSSISGEVGKILANDLVPSMGIDFLGERGSSKEDDKSNEGPFRVEDSTLELDLDANGLFPSYSKKMKVASPRSNLSSFLEDKMTADGLNGDCSKLYQQFTGLAEWKSEKREDSSFLRNTEPSACQSENEMIFGGEDISKKKHVSPDLSLFPSGKSLQKAVSVNSQINAELSCSLPETNSKVFKNLNLLHGNQTSSKNQWTSAGPKISPGLHPLYVSNSRKLQSTHVAKSRTWHRNGNSSVAVADQPTMLPHSQGTKTGRTIQSSYIRKGNSLVRNPSPSAVSSGFHNSNRLVYRLNPCTDKLKNNQASDANAQSIMRTEQVNTSEMPFKTIDALKEHIKSPGVSECRPDSGNSCSSQSTLEEGNPEKKIMYVKRRCNQLIAASDSDMSTLGVDKSQASSSDGYYKRRKNQLVRGTSENHVKEGDANGNLSRLVSHTSLPRTSTRRSSGIAKHLKFPFVWKLRDIQSSEKHKTSVGPQKVLPHMFSWKRATNWRTLLHALSIKPRPNKSSFGVGGQTLLLSRKRGAVYTRSTHGYSLRISKVLSVGGSSLKWSKSIEKSSKKASEEATRAVAAAEKRKKEEKGAVPIASKSRNNVSRERIFRIGSERYKMDPTRGTLHRITEKETSPSVLQTEKNVKRCYVPRRLLIGNEEYVRIGNGNQLVRDPKKRTRVLASEKVRWSLRTARLRLARKRKYCQFFTRFGKCNKDDGKCPYIHDLSKIAVCTKFLNGLCTNVDCKLTHKVIPERMEDCSYFLKGSCSNENCPYRHVNVNPESAVCRNFLRGYCAEGNECRKKHTYVCSAFEATGSCPRASSCKLHHPKKKIEKKQPTSEPNVVRGRYFDGGLIGDADVSDTLTEKVSAKGMDDVGSHEGKFPDYISLDVSDEEMDQTLASDEDCRMDDSDFDFDVLV